MKTQADFELTTEEMAELKALLIPYLNSPQLDSPAEFKKYLLEQKALTLYEQRNINKTLPTSIRYLKNLEFLYINHPALTMLPESIAELENLQHIVFGNRVELVKLPKNIGQLKKLEKLYLYDCSKLEELPESFFQLNNLKELILHSYNVTTLSEQIGQLKNLQKLDLLGCEKLLTLPESIGELTQLKELNLTLCKNLMLPESIQKLEQLEKLDLSFCKNISYLPNNTIKKISYIMNDFDIETIETTMEEIDKLAAQFINQTHKPRITVKIGLDEKAIDLTSSLEAVKSLVNIEATAISAQQENKKSKIKQLTNEQSKQILKELEKQTAQTAIKIKIKEADNLPLTASKFGGVPYWLPETPYPVDKQGNKLLLLAQINFSEMPPLPDFPTTGLLQFLMTHNVYEMNFYDNPTRQDDWRVVYHAEINPAIDESSVLALNIPYAPQIFDEEDDGGFPVDTQYRLSFEPAEIRIGTECIGFDKALKNAAKEAGIKLNKNDLSDLEVLFGEKAWEKIKQHTVENLIGGYPDFTQTDPRDERKYKKHSVLLLQIESDEGIMWGDCGVGNFFIRPDDLRKKDFSKVLFHWDCY